MDYISTEKIRSQDLRYTQINLHSNYKHWIPLASTQLEPEDSR